MNTATYRVAGLIFSLRLPPRVDPSVIFPSSEPFRCNSTDARPGFTADFTAPLSPAETTPLHLLDDSVNDLGRIRIHTTAAGYLVTVGLPSLTPTHMMAVKPGFSEAKIRLDTSAPNATAAAGSLVRLLFSQRILLSSGISIHASTIISNRRAILFLGPSGTGKSTQSQLWIRTVPNTRLLNDDNPILRLSDNGTLLAYGSPWSGKTPCHINAHAPVHAIVRLHQAPADSATVLSHLQAFNTILPSCSVLRQDSILHNALLDTLVRITAQTPPPHILQLHCTPTPHAVETLSQLL